MLGFYEAAAETFTDHFDTLSLRNAIPAGANKIRNSEFFRPAAGVGSAAGDLPENWELVSAIPGVAASFTFGTATIDAQTVRTMDIRLLGTATGTGNYFVYLDGAVIPMANGQNWTISAYTARVGGTATRLGNFFAGLEILGITGFNSVGAENTSWLSEIDTAGVPVSGMTGTLARAQGTGATVAGAQVGRPLFFVQCTAAGAVDCTIRLAGFQAEQGSAASAYVPASANDGRWNTTMYTGQRNVEQQWYTHVARDGTRIGTDNPFSVSGSVLSITARARSGLPSVAGTAKSYTSGMLTTFHGFYQRYGYFEIRSQMPGPNSMGLWPAFWMLPQDDLTYTQQGELDIMEWVSNGVDDANVYQTIHHGTSGQTMVTTTTKTAAAWKASYYTFGMEWRPEGVQYYLDRQKVGPLHPIGDKPDLHQRYYLMINLAVGGSWPGNVTTETGQFPATYKVDWVRGWSRIPF